MKARRSIFWLAAIIVILMALAIWHVNKKSKAWPLAVQAQSNALPASAERRAEPNPASTPVSLNPPSGPNVSGTNPAASAAGLRTDNPKQGLSVLNDVPIVFYGRLEDQFGSPVVNAEIAASIRIFNGVQSTVKRFSVASDANGFFHINEGKGESLGLMPRKDGYALASTETGFKYSYMYNDRFTPDQNNPRVIKMWKLQGSEPLVGINKTYKLQYTNSAITFDLLAGKIVPAGGDIKLTVSRSPGIISERSRLEWSVQVEAVDGGVKQCSDQEALTYQAPESGYQPEINYIFSTNPPYKWFGAFNNGLFLTSRNGKIYSKLGLSFRINDTPDGLMYITFSGVANTNGSRNWEATAPQ